MNSISLHRPWHSLMAAFLVPLLAFLLACGPGEEPTPIPTATAVPATAPAATPTSALPGPVASPTPTSVGTPTPVPTPSEKPKYGGRFLWVGTTYPVDYDGAITGGGNMEYPRVMQWTGTNLFINYQGEKVECEICTEWHLENGGKTMVFNMIQGIKFHNGHEMTSADVAYSLKKIMGEIDGMISARIGVIKEYITSIETPSRYQLKINTARPSVFVTKILAYSLATIYPEGTTRAMLKEKPYGSGPYVLKEAITGASMKFDRNPNYFKQGLPYLDGTDLVIVGDATTRTAAFLTGRVLLASILQPAYMDKLEGMVAEGKLNLEILAGGCGLSYVSWINDKPPFTDKKVRQAINLALDRKSLGEIMYQRWAVPQLMFYGKGQEYAIPEDKIWNVAPGWGTGAKKQQEIEDAKKLLADAGFPNGMDLEQLAIAPTTFGGDAAHEPVQQMLGKIGIRTKFLLADRVTYLRRMDTRDYQITHYTACVPTRDPDEVVGATWITGAARGWFGYSNPEVDRLYPLMSGELDPQKRKELFLRIQDIIILDTVGYAPTPRSDGYIWWWKSFKGVTLGMDGITHMAGGGTKLDRVWIDK